MGNDDSAFQDFETANFGNRIKLGDEYMKQVLTKASREGWEDNTKSIPETTDKMPTNFWHLGLIAAILPNSEIINRGLA